VIAALLDRSETVALAELTTSGKAVVKRPSQIYDRLGLSANTDDHRRVLTVSRFLAGSAGE
jgi:hypothetical protein